MKTLAFRWDVTVHVSEPVIDFRAQTPDNLVLTEHAQ